MSFDAIVNSTNESKAEESDEELDEPIPVVVEDPTVMRLGVIADTEVTLGLLLAGIGYHRETFRNYLMVEQSTTLGELEAFFFTMYRGGNIGIILLDYPTSKRLAHVLGKCKNILPVIIVLPTKTTIMPYLEEKERQRRHRMREAYI